MRFENGDCENAVIFKLSADTTVSSVMNELDKLGCGAHTFIQRRGSGQLLVQYREEAHANRAATAAIMIAANRVEAYRPVQRTERMAIVSVRFDYVGSAPEIARYLNAALGQYGTIMDIVLRIRSLESVERGARILIDRTGQEGVIPAVVQHQGKRMTLTGEWVAPYCVF
ncbi:hypothetical protein H4R19_007299, partial [Coemansia spiralis]